MRFGLLHDRPDHPVLADVVEQLSRAHEVVVLNEETGSPADIAAAEATRPADLYLCKSHTPHALDLAALLEAQGSAVINGSQPTRACQDRVVMAATLRDAGLAAPPTRSLDRLGDLKVDIGPVVVKSRISRRGDVVAHVAGPEDLHALLRAWADEPVVVQPWLINDGWDLKLWAVGSTLFAAHRPSPLDGPSPLYDLPGERATTHLVDDTDLAPAVRAIAAAVGRAFRLDVYGVDIIDGPAGPAVVDVNPFPGARGIPGVARAIVELAEARAALRAASVPV